jgi:hypothetical protein
MSARAWPRGRMCRLQSRAGVSAALGRLWMRPIRFPKLSRMCVNTNNPAPGFPQWGGVAKRGLVTVLHPLSLPTQIAFVTESGIDTHS